MNLMTWSAHFVTGIDEVDAQHKGLVEIINAAAPHLASGGDAAQQAAGPLLDKLVRYAGSHFAYEEQLMHAAALQPDYQAQHLQSHQSFVNEVLQMRAQYETGRTLIGNDLLHFLISWLTFHILSEDKHMARQIQAIQAGQSASDAFAAPDTTIGAPLAVYNAALVDLFSLLTARNRTLTEANAHIREAQQALEAANSQLEARVAERTQALASANTELQAERAALVQSLAQLQQTQEQLLQSEKMAAVGQLAAGVAHEINNPIGFVNSNLGSLSMYVEHLLNVLAAYEPIHRSMPEALRSRIEALPSYQELAFIKEDAPALLQESKEGLARVKRIVNDLRDFSHAGTEQWAQADLLGALDSALNVAGNALKYKATVVKELAPLPPVECIAAQLGQVLVNLLVNAAQAIAENGTITLRSGTSATGDQVWLEVQDSGVGMTAQTQQRIFEPFYTTKPVGQGTGLGLSISWDIVARHHGSLTVQSEPGQGSCFRLTLPRTQPEPAAHPPTTADAAP